MEEAAMPRRAPQAELIADRAVMLIRDRWPTIFNCLTKECLHSIRSIIANDVNCLLKAINGDEAAQKALDKFSDDLASQILSDGSREAIVTKIIESKKAFFSAPGEA